MSEPSAGKWKSLFAFREAALKSDSEAMDRIAKSDPTFLPDENPDDMAFPILAEVIRLHTWVQLGEAEKVRTLVQKNPLLANQPWTFQRWLPITQSAVPKGALVFEVLVSNGADVYGSAEGGFGALHSAAYFGNLEVARRLLELGVEINVEQDDGTTPLSIAKEKGHNTLCDYLIAHGAR